MGNATSSALRTDDPVTSATAPGADSSAFGSLSSLGGSRKFKKKPVLVLDPEELEKAHMLFQDASAELLGEEVERPERSAPLLGLAPMDLDDSEADAADTSDDDAEIIDDDIPSAQDVLRMTASRAAFEETDEAVAEQLEGLDFDHRIFPSLPLKPEGQIAAEEKAERLAAERAASPDDSALDSDDSDEVHVEAPLDRTRTIDPDTGSVEGQRVPDIDPSPASEADNRLHAPFDLDREETAARNNHSEATATQIAPTFPVDPLPEPEAELASDLAKEDHPVEDTPLDPQIDTGQVAEPIASAQAVFGNDPFLDFPTQRLRWVQESTVTWQTEPGAEDAKVNLASNHDATGTAKAMGEPSNHFEWAYEDEDEDDEAEPSQNLASDEPHLQRPDPDSDPEAKPDVVPEPERDGNYTEVHDDQVDGYAFMYARTPRGRTIHALAEGESNSLRAKLIKEREAALTESNEVDDKPSIWNRFTGWLRDLMG